MGRRWDVSVKRTGVGPHFVPLTEKVSFIGMPPSDSFGSFSDFVLFFRHTELVGSVIVMVISALHDFLLFNGLSFFDGTPEDCCRSFCVFQFELFCS